MPSSFTDAEIEYLNSQFLGRLATADADGRPHVIAFVVDDLASVDPWTPRGIEVRGQAETHAEGGEAVGERVGASFKFEPAWIRIRPRRILSWGIDNGSFEMAARDVG